MNKPIPQVEECCATCTDPSGWHRYKCSRRGSYQHEGKLYCKIHHPPTAKAKRDARTKAWNAEYDADRMVRDANAELKTAREALFALVADFYGVLPIPLQLAYNKVTAAKKKICG